MGLAIAGDQGGSTNNGTFANSDAWKNYGVRSNKNPVADSYPSALTASRPTIRVRCLVVSIQKLNSDANPNPRSNFDAHTIIEHAGIVDGGSFPNHYTAGTNGAARPYKCRPRYIHSHQAI
jgi:hypothetical protein